MTAHPTDPAADAGAAGGGAPRPIARSAPDHAQAPISAPLDADDDLLHRTNALALRNTTLGNMLDLCGLALPSGADPGGLPTSILFSAPHGQDDAGLGFGMSIEKAINDTGDQGAAAAPAS